MKNYMDLQMTTKNIGIQSTMNNLLHLNDLTNIYIFFSYHKYTSFDKNNYLNNL